MIQDPTQACLRKKDEVLLRFLDLCLIAFLWKLITKAADINNLNIYIPIQVYVLWIMKNKFELTQATKDLEQNVNHWYRWKCRAFTPPFSPLPIETSAPGSLLSLSKYKSVQLYNRNFV